MDYGDLFRRSWNIVWKNKFMIFLGFLAALGTGTSSGGGGNNVNYQMDSGDIASLDRFDPQLGALFAQRMEEFWIAFSAVILLLICVAFVVAIVFWLLRLTAQGGMIDAASRLDAGEKVSLGDALSAGWHKLGSLVGLNLVMFGIFFVLGLAVAIVLALTLGAGIATAVSAGDADNMAGVFGSISTLVLCIFCLMCLFIPLFAIISIIYPFAQRALILEGKGVFNSVSRGWEVIKANVGPVAILVIVFLLLSILVSAVLIAIFIPVAAVTFGPMLLRFFGAQTIQTGDVIVLCGGILFMWLIGAAINALFVSFRSTTVTLAYQEFTNKGLVEKTVE